MIFKSKISKRFQDIIMQVMGLAVMFIGASGALRGIFTVKDGFLETGGTMLMIASLTIGALLGELINIEAQMERFGEWLKVKTGNGGDAGFVNAFVTASLIVSIGAMAIVGSIQGGQLPDYSPLAVKHVIDFIIIAVMTSAMGRGCIFSVIPVFVFEGGMTLLARLVAPIMTETAISYLSLVGSLLIFCVGVNLVWGKKVSVANMLPSVLLAVLAAYLPWSF